MSKLLVEAGSEQKIPITTGTEQGQDVIVCVCVCFSFEIPTDILPKFVFCARANSCKRASSNHLFIRHFVSSPSLCFAT
jgi:hypothetical protein